MSKPIINKTRTQELSDRKKIALAFVQSSRVKAFPCGRRRSESIGDNPSEQYSIPFDPEARLNTELNNTSHTSLNGYTQTYLKDYNSTTGILSIALAGYLFKINFSGLKTAEKAPTILDIGSHIFSKLTELEKAEELPENTFGSKSKIYANIVLEKIPLLAGEENLVYYTKVLRNQSATDYAYAYLDLFDSDYSSPSTYNSPKDSANYYFSGLSFSNTPLTNIEGTRSTKIVTKNYDNSEIEQLHISLCIFNTFLSESGYKWQINQEAFLPDITHGELEDSVRLDTLIADKIYLKKDNNLELVPFLKLEHDVGANTYQMQFSEVKITPKLIIT